MKVVLLHIYKDMQGDFLLPKAFKDSLINIILSLKKFLIFCGRMKKVYRKVLTCNTHYCIIQTIQLYYMNRTVEQAH